MLFAVINVVALFGNLLTCYAVHRNQALRTVPNVFVVALGVSDILMFICCMPFSVVTLFREEWIFGETFCRFLSFEVFTFGMTSINTVAIIAVSRYFRVVKSVKYPVLFKKQRALVYIAVAWLLAFVGSVPSLFFKKDAVKFQAGKAMCWFFRFKVTSLTPYSLSAFTSQHL